MAYTGILVRGNEDYSTLMSDPPILRELAITAGCLVLGAYGSGGATDIFKLNLAALSKIGVVDGNGNTPIQGFSTSDLPIVFNGTGYIKQAPAYMLVDSMHKFYYAAKGLKQADLNSLVLTDEVTETSLSVPALEFLISKPTALQLTDTTATVSYSNAMATGFRVYNETTGTFLGLGGVSGDAVTFDAQTAGDIVSVVLHDIDYNYSSKIKGTV